MKASAEERLKEVRAGIKEAAIRSGRNPDDVRLIVVTKSFPRPEVMEIFRAGILDFGENKVQELVAKKDGLPAAMRWHFIGHLQTNKVKLLLPHVCMIHSLDRIELAAVIEKTAELTGVPHVDCLVQVNASGETTKFGLAPETVPEFVSRCREFRRIRLQGLMAIGPHTDNGVSAVRKCFKNVRELRDRLRRDFSGIGWDVLSLGMSADYEIAVEEGATHVRIGSAVMGPRESSLREPG
ncbi:MAG: YggS family pyridoxal phosphate enzyme [Omnitrophica bacterium GWA2_52_8]|nr:MAG: YggS family pyridoxal phosphate enzyme [Omnitrophica bacterium GWA2_52_8]